MRTIALGVATLAVGLGVAVGVVRPQSTPVDPAPYLGDGDGGDRGRGGR